MTARCPTRYFLACCIIHLCGSRVVSAFGSCSFGGPAKMGGLPLRFPSHSTHLRKIVWALGLCAAGQSSTMTGAYAGQWVMQADGPRRLVQSPVFPRHRVQFGWPEKWFPSNAPGHRPGILWAKTPPRNSRATNLQPCETQWQIDPIEEIAQSSRCQLIDHSHGSQTRSQFDHLQTRDHVLQASSSTKSIGTFPTWGPPCLEGSCAFQLKC